MAEPDRKPPFESAQAPLIVATLSLAAGESTTTTDTRTLAQSMPPFDSARSEYLPPPSPPWHDRVAEWTEIARTTVADALRRIVLVPETRAATIWSMIAMVAAVVQAIIVPYEAAFEADTVPATVAVDRIAWVIQWIDVALGFRTAFVNADGQVITDPRAMARHYLRTWFAWNVVANFPLELFLSDHETTHALRLNRVLALGKAIGWIRAEEMKLSGSLFVQVYKFLLMLVMIVHYYACIWWRFGIPDGPGQITWSTADPGNPDAIDLHTPAMNEKKTVQYINSVYWVLNILTVPGYADLEVPTFDAKILGLVMFLSALVVFGYVTASVTSILANRDSQRSRYQQKLLSVRQYMDHNNFDDSTRKRVANYYDYLFKRSKGIDAKTIFADLPTTFQAELALGINGHIISKVPLFQDTEIGFMRMLALALQPVLFLPNEYVVKKGDIGSEMFFIHKGRVDVVSEDGSQVFAFMHEGSFFGEIAFFSRPRTASIRAATYTDIYVLSKANLEEVLTFYPAVKERILLAAQERLKENENRQRLQAEQQRLREQSMSRPNTTETTMLRPDEATVVPTQPVAVVAAGSSPPTRMASKSALAATAPPEITVTMSTSSLKAQGCAWDRAPASTSSRDGSVHSSRLQELGASVDEELGQITLPDSMYAMRVVADNRQGSLSLASLHTSDAGTGGGGEGSGGGSTGALSRAPRPDQRRLRASRKLGSGRRISSGSTRSTRSGHDTSSASLALLRESIMRSMRASSSMGSQVQQRPLSPAPPPPATSSHEPGTKRATKAGASISHGQLPNPRASPAASAAPAGVVEATMTAPMQLRVVDRTPGARSVFNSFAGFATAAGSLAASATRVWPPSGTGTGQGGAVRGGGSVGNVVPPRRFEVLYSRSSESANPQDSNSTMGTATTTTTSSIPVTRVGVTSRVTSREAVASMSPTTAGSPRTDATGTGVYTSMSIAELAVHHPLQIQVYESDSDEDGADDYIDETDDEGDIDYDDDDDDDDDQVPLSPGSLMSSSGSEQTPIPMHRPALAVPPPRLAFAAAQGAHAARQHPIGSAQQWASGSRKSSSSSLAPRVLRASAKRLSTADAQSPVVSRSAADRGVPYRSDGMLLTAFTGQRKRSMSAAAALGSRDDHSTALAVPRTASRS
ncbi:Kinesin-like protein kif27 [Allomyces arbusculus]|nr:Kinesin-like protein kif27 [Allomyces arbusculus]